MPLYIKFNTYFLFFYLLYYTVSARSPPNIIFIVADDLGWNDVGFHGSTQIPTPNIDSLAYSGVILNNYYVQPICTPSRSALLSGMHPVHTGLNHDVIYGAQPYGLPLKFPLLPQFLQRLGYKSYIVGKWHLGMFTRHYTPTFRGFHSHYGYWTGHKDYYSHLAMEGPGWWGYDFRRDMKVDREAYGKYTTDLFTEESVRIINEHNASQPLFLYLAHLAVHSANPYEPLQAPAEIIKRFSYIKDENRRKFAAMVWKLDESVGSVIKALQDTGMLYNSIIVFTTDNGGPAAGFDDNAASNWPLRGVKAGLWEGGIRGASFVWSPLINNPGRVSMEMMQIMDWLPTLYRAAGGDLSELPEMDGKDAWDSIVSDARSSRTHMLHNIDPISGSAGLRVGDWKLLIKPSGYGSHWNGWYGPNGRHSDLKSQSKKFKHHLLKKSSAGRMVRKIFPFVNDKYYESKKAAEVLCEPVPKNATMSCEDPERPCLFHIPSDPCEYYDVSHQYTEKLKLLMSILRFYNETAVPPGNKPWDPKANPVYWAYTWINWKDYSISDEQRC